VALTNEWRCRIDKWHKAAAELFYRPLGQVDLSGFVTREQLAPAEAAKREFRPMPPGTRWGGKWEYAWLRGSIVVPGEAAGGRLVMHLQTATQGELVWVDGVACHGWGRQHVLLARSAEAGRKIDLLAEVYAGHGPRPCGGGPVADGAATVPEPPPTQVEMGATTFGLWQEDVYQLWLDVQTLLELRDKLDANSLRVSEIDQAMRDYTLMFDPELPREEMLASARAARRRLRPLLECRNGPTTPVMFGFGHGHLDVAWLWPLAESRRKIARTIVNQLTLAEEYGEHRFLQPQAVLYRMLKRGYPDIYERVRRAVAAGHVIPDGATWVEMDTNVTGGESLIRQFLHGKRLFREEFGVECRMLWLPDVFGYTAALPQVLRGCGVEYFTTAKIYWNYHGGEDFPHTTFWWQGIDGTEVKCHLMNSYGDDARPRNLIDRWNERKQKDGISTRLFPVGFGDGGGGPTREHLEYARRTGDLEGCPKFRMSSPMEFFADQDARGWPDVHYVGELYLQCHRGTYTSQARTKRGNRKAELALREAEMWSAAAAALAGFTAPAAELDEAWKTVLLNQFHDILPGSSIARVYEEAEAAYAQTIATAQRTAHAAAAALAKKKDASLSVFNSLSWPRRAMVELPAGSHAAADADGAALAVQEIEGRTFVEVDVPGCGWTTVRPAAGPAPKPDDGAGVTATAGALESELVRVELNARGEVVSLFDKASGRELAAAPCGLRMFKDVPGAWDAWDLDSMARLLPVELGEEAEMEPVASGPLAGAVRIRRRVHNSRLEQTVTLRRGARRVEFHTVIDWREKHKLLKAAFPLNVHANHAIHEIQFGHVRRPNHYSRQYDADRFEVTNHKWTALAEEGRGAAVLNDCKYGVSVLGNTISLSLLRAPQRPDMNADRGRQELTYAVCFWTGALLTSGVVREAYELNVPPLCVPLDAGSRSLLALDADNVVIETVKLAEDGGGGVVVRLYESMRTATRCTLTTTRPVASAEQTDMLEGPGRALDVSDGRIDLDFRPFEIKTLRLRLR